jgi:hypothetical protein
MDLIGKLTEHLDTFDVDKKIQSAQANTDEKKRHPELSTFTESKQPPEKVRKRKLIFFIFIY